MISAHGEVPGGASLSDILGSWPFDPLMWLFVVGAGWLYMRAARRAVSWPPVRRTHFLLGLIACWVALATPVAVYAGVLFWVHMVQHLLLVLVAAPLLALGAPVALMLRVSSPETRRRLLSALGSPMVRFISHPAVTWLLFVAVLWISHLSGVYDAALENPWVHGAEHFVYLGVAFLFWQPVIGLDPRPGKLSPPARVAYLLAAIPMQSFLGVALYSADRVLYPHYETLARQWGPSALDDQRAAALIMWLGGDALMLTALGFALLAWMRAEARMEIARAPHSST
jgi:putative copper resistance protein D